MRSIEEPSTTGGDGGRGKDDSGGGSGGGGGGGDGEKPEPSGQGDDGQQPKAKSGILKGWEERVAYDPELPVKVAMEQVGARNRSC